MRNLGLVLVVAVAVVFAGCSTCKTCKAGQVKHFVGECDDCQIESLDFIAGETSGVRTYPEGTLEWLRSQPVGKVFIHETETPRAVTVTAQPTQGGRPGAVAAQDNAIRVNVADTATIQVKPQQDGTVTITPEAK
ncbi:hypothetical protein FACS1894139_00600 [Planctomycetales bacterium]|nr:hypothetical protein FACS1894107_01470 [Planctomycetales bacterium]GHS99346.1 hypothetical protein FACS1894108_09150 [Planctomycetales bacterium]GHT02439.1 hypothetical protein FACS1894139_00600 [Planctomycetales bacterium]GHV23289.1 hypothetical protein AGMMS49959_15890 [Planctomycetales bacterium]